MTIEIFGCIFSQSILEARILVAGRTAIRYTLDRQMERVKVEQISKALADGTRLKIFEAISRKDRVNCGQIVSLRGVTPATVSHHLKILSEAGLIACCREGQFIYNRAVPETMEAYTRALAKISMRKRVARRA